MEEYTAFDNPDEFIATIQKEYLTLPAWFPLGDDPDITLRVWRDTDMKASAEVTMALAAVRTTTTPFVNPLLLSSAVKLVASLPFARLHCFQGTLGYATCSLCRERPTGKAYACHTGIHDGAYTVIVCEACHNAAAAHGHDRQQPLDFDRVPRDEMLCVLCGKRVLSGKGGFWCSSDHDDGVLCFACGETEGGRRLVTDRTMNLHPDTRLRGENEALGLQTWSHWIPVLRGINDAEDDTGEYAMVWANVHALQSVMLSVIDDHGREGFFVVNQTLEQVLDILSHCGIKHYISQVLNYPVHYG